MLWHFSANLPTTNHKKQKTTQKTKTLGSFWFLIEGSEFPHLEKYVRDEAVLALENRVYFMGSVFLSF